MRGGLRPCLVVALLGACVLGSSPAGAQVLGASRAQTLSLSAGPNLVSLHVVPGATDLATLLAPVMDRVLVVQDAQGRVYAPAVGSRALADWAWSQAYLVHLRSAATLTVTGPAVQPESALPLGAGWNWVPYLLDTPQPVEAALASILPYISRVEDGDGRVYPSASGQTPLSEMTPGHGYRIRLTQPATLVYAPANPSSPPPPPPTQPMPSGGDYTVGTLAEALALTTLAPGQTVSVQGYHTPGDGGGGRFLVSDRGERPDGGVVFVPDAALSAWQTHVQTGPNSPAFDYGPILPDGVHVPHRDWTMTYAPSSGAGPFTINAWQHLAGHRYASGGHLTPGYDGRGVGRIPYQVSSYGPGTWTLRYRATTSPLRLVRQDVGQELNVRWFGVRAENEAARPSDVTIGSDFDAQVAITWAINLAQRRNDPIYGGTPGTITAVRVPGPATYRFAGPIELTDGLALVGDGGTEVVDATTTIQGTPGVPEADVSAQLREAGYAEGVEHPWAGYRTAPGGSPMAEQPGSIARWSHQGGVLTVRYRPVRVMAAPTRLRLFDGIVHLGVRMSAPSGHRDALPPDVNFFAGKYHSSVTASSSPRANGATPTVITGDGVTVMRIAVRNLVLDGNHEGNRELWEQNRFGWPGNSQPPEFEEWMRNTPSWGGICVSNHGGKRIPAGQTIELRGVAVLGFGSNGLLGHTANRWDGEAVLIGNSLWNHTLYGANGRFRDLTVTGFAWTHLTPTANDVENLVYERPEPAPYRPGGILGQRGFDLYANTDFPAGFGYGITHGGIPGGFRVNGYVADGRGEGSPAFILGSGMGPSTRFEGAIFLRDGGNMGVYGEGHNGYAKGLWSDNRFERVLMTRGAGGENNGFAASGPFDGLTSRDHVEVQLDADTGEDGHYGAPIRLVTGWSDATRGAAAAPWPDGTPSAGTRPWDRRLVQVVDGLRSGASTTGALVYTNRLMRANDAYGGPESPLFRPDPAAPAFDVRSGGSRLFVLDAHTRNVTNTLVQHQVGNATGAERHVEVFIRNSTFQIHDYGVGRLQGALRVAYFDRVTFRGSERDRQPGRIYTSEDTQSYTASGGETAADLPTNLFERPVAPWSVGNQSFTGGTVSFSGSAAARVAGYEWVQRPTGSEPGQAYYPDDWRAPILRVTFRSPLAAGETFTATMAVRPWPAVGPTGLAVTVPTR